MDDKDQENREHIRGKDHQRNERQRETYNHTDENKEIEEITLEDINFFCKDKYFQKVMDILLNKEKEKYFLKLA